MTARLVEARSLIDECLPSHDFSAVYEIRIEAPASVVYERLLSRISENCGWCAF